MTTLQQQIHQLALLLKQLASQIKEPVVNNREFDLDKILLEAQQFHFEYHLVGNQDEYVKTIYLQTLLTVMNYVNSELDERFRLIARIYYALNLPENFYMYIQKSKTLTLEDMQQFYQVVNENKLTDVFLIDILMLLGVKQEKLAIAYVSELISSLDISERHFQKACQVVSGLLKVNHKKLKNIFLQDRTFQTSSSHYLMAIDSHFAPKVHIIGNGKTEVNLQDFYTNTLILSNVILFIPKGLEVSNMHEIRLENCTIKSDDLDFCIMNVNTLRLENLNFEYCKKITSIQIKNCTNVELERIEIDNQKVYSNYLFYIDNSLNFSIKHCKFKNIVVYSSQPTSIFGEEEFFKKKTAFIHVKQVNNIINLENKITDCKIFSKGILVRNESYKLDNLLFYEK